MGFLFPWGFLFMLLSIPIIIFYLLKLKREERTVSSNFLWRRVLEDRQANAPWQKLQKNWLLLLQLLLLLIFCIVISQPVFSSNAEVTGNIIVLLDSSASMQSTDVQPTRFAKAKDEISKLIDNMGGSDQMTLVSMHSYPEVLLSNSNKKIALKDALDKVKVTNEVMNSRSALTLAAAAADRTPGTTVVVVSNGGFARAEDLPPLKAKVVYRKIGANDNNQAITGLRLRETGSAPQLFVGLYNYSTNPATINLQVTVDGKSFFNKDIPIGGNDKADQTLTDLPLTAKNVNAKIKPVGGSQDFLEVDNQAWTIRNAGDPQKVLIITQGNTFLEALAKRLPGYKFDVKKPADYPALKNLTDYNLFIFDEFAPDQPPANGGVWMINPPTSPLLPITGKVQEPKVGRLEQNDPVLKYTDLTSVAIAEAASFDVPGWARVLVATGQGQPLVIAGEKQGQRIVVMGFGLHNSDLALNVSFPLLMVNTMGWLQPQGAVDNVTEVAPGVPVGFRVSAGELITVKPPTGNSLAVKPTNQEGSFTETGQLGVYAVTRQLEGTTSDGKPRIVNENFVVNLFNPTVSNIRPLDELNLQDATATGPNGTNQTKNDREIWQPIALAALIILMLEWFIFYRTGAFLFPKRKANSSNPTKPQPQA